jgi:hypothetical protein
MESCVRKRRRLHRLFWAAVHGGLGREDGLAASHDSMRRRRQFFGVDCRRPHQQRPPRARPAGSYPGTADPTAQPARVVRFVAALLRTPWNRSEGTGLSCRSSCGQPLGRKVMAHMHVRSDASAVNRAPAAVLVRRPGASPVAAFRRKPAARSEEGRTQCASRPDANRRPRETRRRKPPSHSAYSAAAAISPLMSRPSADALTRTVSPSLMRPCRMNPASGFCSSRWITRFSGRAP